MGDVACRVVGVVQVLQAHDLACGLVGCRYGWRWRLGVVAIVGERHALSCRRLYPTAGIEMGQAKGLRVVSVTRPDDLAVYSAVVDQNPLAFGVVVDV